MSRFTKHFIPALAAWVLLSAAVGCNESPQTPAERHPMILFAVDGMEWRVIAPLIESGELPVLAGLMQRGTYGYLRSMKPTFSAVIWTTLATGKLPVTHGIQHFIYETRPGSNDYRYYTSGHRQTKAFWNMLSDYKLRVHTLGWWITYPAEPVDGIMVSQTNTTSVLRAPQRALWKGSLLKGVEGQVYPTDYQGRVMNLLEDVDRGIDEITTSIFGSTPHASTAFSQLMWDQTLWAFRADATYLRVADDILKSGEAFDLLAVYIGGPDVAGHRFWQYAYPEQFEHPPDRAQIENYGEVIRDYYRYVDRSMGNIIDNAPPGTTVVIVSDHGMHAVNTERAFSADDPPQFTNSGNHDDAPAGVFVAAGVPFRSDVTSVLDLASLKVVGSVLDITPTICWIKGLPVARDFEGNLLDHLLDPDWVARHEAKTIDTFDDPTWQASRAERIRDAIDQNERLEQLRSLGYIK